MLYATWICGAGENCTRVQNWQSKILYKFSLFSLASGARTIFWSIKQTKSSDIVSRNISRYASGKPHGAILMFDTELCLWEISSSMASSLKLKQEQSLQMLAQMKPAPLIWSLHLYLRHIFNDNSSGHRLAYFEKYNLSKLNNPRPQHSKRVECGDC